MTAKRVANEKQTGRYADGGGLYLQVGPTGTKSWLFRFMLNGKAREMGLGSLHTVSLAEARNRAASSRLLLLDGVDPIGARGEALARERAEKAKSKTFRHCATEYIKSHR
ncbi:MAG: Arm DNA-binding domain-containing protein, partial [Usitatibacter sp.]